MTTEAQAIETAGTGSGLTDRLRNQWSSAQSRFGLIEQRAKAQWIAMPDQLKAVLDRMLARLVERLNLPTRADLAELHERIEELHRKLAAYEATRAGASATVPAPAATVAAPAVADGDSETHQLNRKPDSPTANKTARRKHK